MENTEDSWLIVVFSYNRNVYLNNCLESIRVCASEIDAIIIDDGSTDKATLDVLNKAEFKKHFACFSSENGSCNKRLGGLYKNMQFAMNYAKENEKKYVIFIQDDMQFVRPVVREDFDSIEKYFYSKNVFQVNACFMKLLSIDFYREHLLWNIEEKYYEVKVSNGYKVNFSDVGVFSVSRFFQGFNEFENSEFDNNKKAVELGVKRVTMANPFMMWLPFSKSYYRKNSPMKTKIIEFLAGCRFYSISIMSENEIRNLKIRCCRSNLPIAENFLNVTGLTKRSTWAFSAGMINLYARGGIRKKIAKLLWKSLS
ncbi:MAG: glycosyltransferase [Saccharospirillum sp.]